MKRAGKLFDTLISEDNLLRAIDEVNRTHHWNRGHKPNTCTAWVEETKPQRVEDLRRILVGGFESKKPHVSQRWDANARKWRTISEPAQWPDQYVHHALIQVLQPKMMQGMDFYCCGSIRERGPHREKNAIQRWMKYDRKGTKYEFCGDIRHFYDSLTPEVVMARMRQLYKDRRVLDLIRRIIRDGVKLGTYTSQWFANAVLQPLDRLHPGERLLQALRPLHGQHDGIRPQQTQVAEAPYPCGELAERPRSEAQGRLAGVSGGKTAAQRAAAPAPAGLCPGQRASAGRCRLPVRERVHHPPQAESAAH